MCSPNLTALGWNLQAGGKCGETMKVTIDGVDEEEAAIQIEAYFKANL